LRLESATQKEFHFINERSLPILTFQMRSGNCSSVTFPVPFIAPQAAGNITVMEFKPNSKQTFLEPVPKSGKFDFQSIKKLRWREAFSPSKMKKGLNNFYFAKSLIFRWCRRGESNSHALASGGF
jgi:hypothetical protein